MRPFERLLAEYRDVVALSAAQSLLAWDQQVLMPAGGSHARAAHSQILKRMVHERLTGNRFLDLVAEAEQQAAPDTLEAQALAALRRDVDVLTKLPTELVERKARITAEAYEVWKVAKPANDFAAIAPYYRDLFGIARETAEAIGYDEHPYDPLIALYEFGARHRDAAQMFEAIKTPIVNLVAEIRESGTPIDDEPLKRGFQPETLRGFAQEAASAIGFDFGRGRLDVCRNAFCTHLSRSDVRMTTRPSSHFKGIVSSSLHEMGHGLYEQGISPELEGTPLAGGVSLAVHESQSRLWENIVGRSQAFWRHFTPMLHMHVPELADADAERMAAMMSRVQPEFVRVGADELTYNLHILIRFELEVAIVTGDLDLKDLPGAWNDRYEAYLGIRPATDTDGCLQDVHWCRGSIGYFPTYAMGNLIGGQIWECLARDLGDLDALMERGDFGPILGWLQDRIYLQGKRYAPSDLVQSVTGSPMNAAAWLTYATTKYRALYQL